VWSAGLVVEKRWKRRRILAKSQQLEKKLIATTMKMSTGGDKHVLVHEGTKSHPKLLSRVKRNRKKGWKRGGGGGGSWVKRL